jgi:hypothetical protein
VSELNAEQSGGEVGSLAGAAVPNSSDRLIETVMASVQEARRVESPAIAPDHEAPRADEPKVDEPKADEAKPDEIKPDEPKLEAAKTGVENCDVKAEAPRMPGELLIVSPGQRGWESRTPEPHAPKAAGKRGFAAMAAMLVLALLAGVAGGAVATAGLAHLTETAAATSSNPALETSIARIDAEIVALKAGLEQTSKASVSQFNRANDRLEHIEKAQAEPAARLAKLSEAVEKLRAASAATAPKEVTGAVTAPTGAQAVPLPQPSPVAAAPKTDVGRLPTVEGWVLRDVGHGAALIESRTGLYEVYAGDPVPGLGRVDAIRRQDGRWVVVTTKGLIVSR